MQQAKYDLYDPCYGHDHYGQRCGHYCCYPAPHCLSQGAPWGWSQIDAHCLV